MELTIIELEGQQWDTHPQRILQAEATDIIFSDVYH